MASLDASRTRGRLERGTTAATEHSVAAVGTSLGLVVSSPVARSIQERALARSSRGSVALSVTRFELDEFHLEVDGDLLVLLGGAVTSAEVLHGRKCLAGGVLQPDDGPLLGGGGVVDE